MEFEKDLKSLDIIEKIIALLVKYHAQFRSYALPPGVYKRSIISFMLTNISR